MNTKKLALAISTLCIAITCNSFAADWHDTGATVDASFIVGTPSNYSLSWTPLTITFDKKVQKVGELRLRSLMSGEHNLGKSSSFNLLDSAGEKGMLTFTNINTNTHQVIDIEQMEDHVGPMINGVQAEGTQEGDMTGTEYTFTAFIRQNHIPTTLPSGTYTDTVTLQHWE